MHSTVASKNEKWYRVIGPCILNAIEDSVDSQHL